jgi:hypothetical protein
MLQSGHIPLFDTKTMDSLILTILMLIKNIHALVVNINLHDQTFFNDLLEEINFKHPFHIKKR